MSRDFWIVFTMLIANLIAAVIYLVLHCRKKDRVRGLLVFAFFLVFPCVGFCFYMIGEIQNRILFRKRRHDISAEELSFSTERIRVLTDADLEKALNTVPVEEALLVSDKVNKRTAFIDILKTEDYDSSIVQIQDAVSNDDTEISHYAASFITDIIARYKAKEAEYRKAVDADPSKENLKRYVDYMEDILQKDVFGIVELKAYVELFDRASRMLYEMAPEELNDYSIAVLLDCWSKVGNPDRQAPWIARTRSRCRDSLDSFKMCASYYFRVNDRENLFYLLKEVRRSSIYIDNEALHWIRYFE